MLFAVRRPNYEREYYHPAMRMFQQPRLDLEDLILPTAAMMALCGSNAEDFIRAKKSRNEDNSQQKNAFEVKVDVQHFSPEELEVKTVDNFVVVTGKHEEKGDEHGYISRQFGRRYPLPEGVKADAITCNISSDGILHISAPLQIQNTPQNEIQIPISFTGAPAKIANMKQEISSEKETPTENSVAESQPPSN